MSHFLFYANFIHQLLEPFHTIVAFRSFDKWTLDVITPTTPIYLSNHAYIIVDMDYFSKWAKVLSFKESERGNTSLLSSELILYIDMTSHYYLRWNMLP